MPYFFVNTDVSDCITTMSELLTVAIVSVTDFWWRAVLAIALVAATAAAATSANAKRSLRRFKACRSSREFVRWPTEGRVAAALSMCVASSKTRRQPIDLDLDRGVWNA
jgi:hypothetical protein